jgi:hypothetical protein
MMALGLSIAAILLYVSVRFEYKMSITAVVALVHDIPITLASTALLGAEVTPNTIAALLTILGYSLYDTIVVFHRIKENSQHLAKQTFMQMANESINEVLVRSINTTVTSLIPVLVMLFFGGETLRDFALALSIGLVVEPTVDRCRLPLYAVWKETELQVRGTSRRSTRASNPIRESLLSGAGTTVSARPIRWTHGTIKRSRFMGSDAGRRRYVTRLESATDFLASHRGSCISRHLRSRECAGILEPSLTGLAFAPRHSRHEAGS